MAELAGSMLGAAPWAALFSLLAAGLIQVDRSRRPQDLDYLFALTLLGSWSVLAANKVAEGRAVDLTTRRVFQLIAGAALGLLAYFLAGWMMVEPGAGGTGRFRSFGLDLAPPGPLGSAAFFGLAALAIDWWTLTDRDRKARFRVVPIAKAALLAAIPGFLIFPPNATRLRSRRWS